MSTLTAPAAPRKSRLVVSQLVRVTIVPHGEGGVALTLPETLGSTSNYSANATFGWLDWPGLLYQGRVDSFNSKGAGLVATMFSDAPQCRHLVLKIVNGTRIELSLTSDGEPRSWAGIIARLCKVLAQVFCAEQLIVSGVTRGMPPDVINALNAQATPHDSTVAVEWVA